MSAAWYILAASNENDFTKVVFGVIFAAIWAISAAASAWSKKKQEERRRKVQEELERASRTAPNWGEIASESPRVPPRRTPGLETPPAPLPPKAPPNVPPREPVRRSPPPPPARTPQQRLEKRKAKPPKPPKSPKPPPVPVPATAQASGMPPSSDPLTKSWSHESSSAYATARQAPLAGARRKAPVGVDAKAIRSWLQPATLRRQFILTEVLQPPVAMRPPRD